MIRLRESERERERETERERESERARERERWRGRERAGERGRETETERERERDGERERDREGEREREREGERQRRREMERQRERERETERERERWRDRERAREVLADRRRRSCVQLGPECLRLWLLGTFGFIFGFGFAAFRIQLSESRRNTLMCEKIAGAETCGSVTASQFFEHAMSVIWHCPGVTTPMFDHRAGYWAEVQSRLGFGRVFDIVVSWLRTLCTVAITTVFLSSLAVVRRGCAERPYRQHCFSSI